MANFRELNQNGRMDAYALEDVQIDVIFYELLLKGKSSPAYPVLEAMADIRRDDGLTIAEELMGERNGWHPALIRYGRDENGVYHVNRNEKVFNDPKRLEEFTAVCLDHEAGYHLPDYLFDRNDPEFIEAIIDASLSDEPGNPIDEVLGFVESLLNCTANDALEFLKTAPAEQVKEEIKWRLADSTIDLTLNRENGTIDLNGQPLCTATDLQMSPSFCPYENEIQDLELELADWLDRGGSVPAALYGNFCSYATEVIEGIRNGRYKPMLFDNLILARQAIEVMSENGYSIENIFLEPAGAYPYESTIEKYNREIKSIIGEEKSRELEKYVRKSPYKDHNYPGFVKIPNTGNVEDVCAALDKLNKQLYGNSIEISEPKIPSPEIEKPKGPRKFANLDISH